MVGHRLQNPLMTIGLDEDCISCVEANAFFLHTEKLVIAIERFANHPVYLLVFTYVYTCRRIIQSSMLMVIFQAVLIDEKIAVRL